MGEAARERHAGDGIRLRHQVNSKLYVVCLDQGPGEEQNIRERGLMFGGRSLTMDGERGGQSSNTRAQGRKMTRSSHKTQEHQTRAQD